MRRSIPTILAVILIIFAAGFVIAQVDEMSAATASFQNGNYANAVTELKKVTSKSPINAQAWLLLGSSYYRLAKFKESVAAFDRAVAIDPSNETAHINLATAYLARNDKRGQTIARETLAINPKNAQASFVVAVFEYREKYYDSAYKDARKAISFDPKLAEAYLVIYHSLVASFAGLTGKVVAPAARAELITKAVDAFEKYYDLASAEEKTKLAQQVSDLRSFAEYYNRPEAKLALDAEKTEEPEPGTTSLKILSKPNASFTDKARNGNVNGTVLLLVGFKSDGSIGAIMLLKSLEKDLDQNCIAAARSIKFVPASKNGTPISVVKMVEYSFTLY
jgi:tetratricopeptide (TPR) repeat protein